MSSHRIRKTPLALTDINQIADWLLERSGSAAVVSDWLDALEDRFRKIANVSGTGTIRPELENGLRSSPFGNYIIFFRHDAGTLMIVRVLHASRDLSHGIQLH